MNQRVARAMRAANRHYADGGDVQDNRSMFSRAADTAMDYAGRGLALGDLYTGGVLSSLAGLNPFGSYSDVMAAREKALAGVPREAKALATEPINPVAAIFAGPMARTANKVMLRRAEELAGQNAPREQIWNETGWFQGPDKKWRFEIDDSQAFIKGGDVSASESARRWGPRFVGATQDNAVMAHDKLIEAYPEMSDVRFQGSPGITSYVQYDLLNPDAPSLISVGDMHRGAAKTSSGLHEAQHWAQDREGFSLGYNPIEAAKDIADARYQEQNLNERLTRIQNAHSDEARVLLSRAARGDAGATDMVEQAKKKWFAKFGEKSDDNPFGVDPQDAVTYELSETDNVLNSIVADYNKALKVSKLDPHALYRRHAGEVEARTVQKRMDMTPEQRRARAPWLDYDVPEADQIVRMK